jgi:NAD dependent epimerase/dehydratase
MKLQSKNVVVTGAGGFIGSHLVERLVREGCRVKAVLHYDSRSDQSNLEFLDHSVLQEVEVVSGDVQDPFFMATVVQNAEVVFHLAALIGIPYSYAAPASYVNTNVQGTLNVLQACLSAGVERLVHTSTSECYGTAQYVPIDEQHPLQAQSPYSASKMGADKLAESFYRSFDLPVAIIRPFNTYGPRQSARAVIPTVLSQLLSGATELRVGSLEPIRDFNYVKDTVAGFLAVAESDKAIGEVINIGSGYGVTIGEFVETAMNVVGRHIPVVQDTARVRPDKSEVFSLICGNEKAKSLTGWQPTVTLEVGVRETAEFIAAHLHLYQPQEYAI